MFGNKIVQMATAPQGQMRAPMAPQGFGNVLMGLMGDPKKARMIANADGTLSNPTSVPAPGMTVSQDDYDAIMAKVRAGKPRSDRETQKLQQYLTEHQGPGSSRIPAAPAAPVPTYMQEGGLPRAIFNPFGLLADAMKPRQ